jgi:hypothetical protein
MLQCNSKCLMSQSLCKNSIFVTTSLVVFLTCLVYRSWLFAGLLVRPLKVSFDAGSGDMGETHAYTRRLDRFGLDKVPRLVARTLRETGIAATQIKCATPSHELTTSIPHEDVSWSQGRFATCPLAKPRRMAGCRHRSDRLSGRA